MSLSVDSTSSTMIDCHFIVSIDTNISEQSTFTDERGHYYGIGSLQQTLVNGKRKYSEVSSSAFLDMNKQQGSTIAEQGATIAEQAKQINEFAVVKKFLSATDHRFDQFVSTNSTT
ncbi:hypothetical protein DY000_02060194 [Brassica cretica]|uniref:t-SNARE coiled-coil homology domain-containing protein n=1 Tax=Brassica cretica TaxID=69181 RepID=A0ABQ7AUB8_BRACR|nr:hypothetical protein DY000_02060194 [Brassica cretica]